MTQHLCCYWFIILKIVDLRLIISYFGALSMHQIAPFLPIFFRGACPRPPSTNVNQPHNAANYMPAM